MKLNLFVRNEDQAQLVSSVLQSLPYSPFNDVTLVCSDGQLEVNCFTLALLLPAPYRSMHLDEGALLILPDHKVQEFQLIMDPEQQERGIAGQLELEQNSKISIQNECGGNIQGFDKVIDKEHDTNFIEPYKDLEHHFDLEDSSDEDEDNSARKYVPREEHLPAGELAQVTARYVQGVKSTSGAWMVVNETFVFHKSDLDHTRKGKTRKRRKMVSWVCSGKWKQNCPAKASTLRVGAGSPESLVWLWRPELHSCTPDYTYIFTIDIKNMTKQMWTESPEGFRNFRTVFDACSRLLISRIPSKDLRKRIRKVCRGDLYKSCRIFFSKWRMAEGRQAKTQLQL